MSEASEASADATGQGQPFLQGVNYWPRRKAMRWWSEFDPAEVDEEFGVIAALGLQLVRIFLLWDDWQPRPDEVSARCLDDLEAVCDCASRHGLRLDITFFTGHMSGPNWAPGWLLSSAPADASKLQVVSGGDVVLGGYRNPFFDPVALEAEELLLRTVVGRLAGHPAVYAWNLGNEPDLFAWPRDHREGRAWTRRMATVIRELDDRPVTCGLHVASLLEDNGLRVDGAFAETDFAVMHAYPMYLELARGPLDPDLVPFTCALTSALSGKPVLMEEWGGCTAPPGEPSQTWRWTSYGRPRSQFMAAEEELAEYIAAVLPRLVEVGATGSLLWCFADYDESLHQLPPLLESRHERHFGLLRADGSLKPHAEEIARFAAERPTVVEKPRRRVELDVTPEEYYSAPVRHAERLYRAYLEQVGGEAPA